MGFAVLKISELVGQFRAGRYPNVPMLQIRLLWGGFQQRTIQRLP